MTNKDRFSTISPTLIQYLNAELTNWEELIPEDYDTSNLNEKSLIKLLKDKKHKQLDEAAMEHYRWEMHKLAINPQRMFIDAMKDSIEFHIESSDKWYEFEEKLNNTFINFLAKKTKISNVHQLQHGLDYLVSSVNKKYQEVETKIDSNIKKDFEDYFGIKVVSGVEISEPDKNVIIAQIPKFQEASRNNIRDSKKFFNETIKELIQQKISLIEQGELPTDAFNKSDLFTDEEVNSIRSKQKDLLVGVINRNKQANLDAFDEVTYKYLGVKGKENIMEVINNVSNDLISEEAKNMLSIALDSGFILPKEDEEFARSKRGIVAKSIICSASVVSATLSSESLKTQISKQAKTELKNTPESVYDNEDFKWCNPPRWAFFMHLGTLGWCTWKTIDILVKGIIKENRIDPAGIGNVLSFAAFWVGALTSPVSMTIMTLIIDFFVSGIEELCEARFLDKLPDVARNACVIFASVNRLFLDVISIKISCGGLIKFVN